MVQKWKGKHTYWAAEMDLVGLHEKTPQEHLNQRRWPLQPWQDTQLKVKPDSKWFYD